jgi:hypothetical protein
MLLKRFLQCAIDGEPGGVATESGESVKRQLLIIQTTCPGGLVQDIYLPMLTEGVCEQTFPSLGE